MKHENHPMQNDGKNFDWWKSDILKFFEAFPDLGKYTKDQLAHQLALHIESVNHSMQETPQEKEDFSWLIEREKNISDATREKVKKMMDELESQPPQEKEECRHPIATYEKAGKRFICDYCKQPINKSQPPQDIDKLIEDEANWRATNGHGGVDEVTRDNFIEAARFGYSIKSQD